MKQSFIAVTMVTLAAAASWFCYGTFLEGKKETARAIISEEAIGVGFDDLDCFRKVEIMEF
jgi:hypothetical protein